MWGTQAFPELDVRKERFIPTHVGNTSHGYNRGTTIAVHPHACGEHTMALTERVHLRGSSPRMWGTLEMAEYLLDLSRFIPTHVGNTSLVLYTCWAMPVHPHACGEHKYLDESHYVSDGSSPRMWGTLAIFIPSFCLSRFIPTHVGNTGEAPVFVPALSVHPHACGEHI